MSTSAGQSVTPTVIHTRAQPAAPAPVTRKIAGELDLRAAARAEGDDDTPGFAGYAVIWDVEDSWGTTFAPRCASAGGLDEDLYALLDMHNPTAVIGTFKAREDDTGLWIEGDWDDTTAGRDARARAKSGSSAGLSVGFEAVAFDPEDGDRFVAIRLVEVSQITARMQAVPGAGFSEARVSASGTPLAEVAEVDQETAQRVASARARLKLARLS